MAKMIVKRVGVLSAAKMYSMVGLGIGLIVGVIYGLIFMIFGTILLTGGGSSSSGSSAGAGAGGIVVGLLIMVGLPIIYAVFCFVAGAIGAFIYNLASRIAGGIELDLEPAAPDYGAPPQPQYGNQY